MLFRFNKKNINKSTKDFIKLQNLNELTKRIQDKLSSYPKHDLEIIITSIKTVKLKDIINLNININWDTHIVFIRQSFQSVPDFNINYMLLTNVIGFINSAIMNKDKRIIKIIEK